MLTVCIQRITVHYHSNDTLSCYTYASAHTFPACVCGAAH